MSMGHHGGGGGGHGGGGRFRGGGGGGGFLFGPSYGVVDDDDSDYVLVRRPRVSFMGEMLETLDSELFNTTKNPISRRFEIAGNAARDKDLGSEGRHIGGRVRRTI